MRALVVDADARAAHAISRMLVYGNIGVDQACLAKDGIEHARRYQYDIVLLDLVMPDLSSAQLLRRMRSICLTGSMLVLSRLNCSQARTVALEAGADGYLVKPFERTELHSRIRTLLLGTRKSDPARSDAAIGRHTSPWVRTGPAIRNGPQYFVQRRPQGRPDASQDTTEAFKHSN